MTKKEEILFEKAMEQLETTVRKLEGGSLTLDDSLKAFEEGVAWSRKCEAALTQAEGKIEKLLKSGTEPFTVPED